ncbi:murein biosynthesis integral membrane protein MurJ [Candidatus Thioglobus sp.]|nr:murein biosynthesis integral membrane protein MurJ [Candidatus Thioglobus sp.]
MSKSFIRSSSIVSAMTFISRILGLIRDFIIARLFGANELTDAFLVAFRIPNFFRRLFAEGAFSQAFLPILAETKANENDIEVQLVINHIATKLLSVLMIITLIAVVAAPLVIFIFAWGFYFKADSSQFNLASDMLRITFPYLLLISLTALSGSILNTYDNFTVPAFTPVLLNISLILSAIYLSQYLNNPIMALAWGVLIGGILQLAFQIPFLRKIKKLPKLQFGYHKTIDTLKKRMLPALFGVSVSQINLLVDTMIASTLIAGSVSWLYYSDRLLELPLALIGIALATVALAKLSNYHALKDTENFIKTINKALIIALIFGFPACLGLILYSKELIITLFQYGEFSVNSAIKTSYSLQAYGSGLMAFIAIKIFAPVFLSRGDTKTPVKAGIVAMVSNIILNLILVQFYGHIGLAAATSLSALLNASILYFYLIKQSIFKFDAAFYKMLTRVIFAVTLMSSYIMFFDTNIEAYFDSSIFDRCWLLFKSIAISASIYFLSLFFFGVRFKDL